MRTTPYTTLLRAVADHMDAHDGHLVDPWIRPESCGLGQLQIPAPYDPQGFIDWCRSLGVVALEGIVFPDSVHLHARSIDLGGVAVADVWAGIDKLQRHFVSVDHARVSLTVDELQHWADEGVLPRLVSTPTSRR